jgi:hypothetical protein
MHKEVPVTPIQDIPKTESETTTSSKRARIVEEINCTGDQLLGKVRELLHEGNVRHIALKNEDGHTFVEFPLTVGVAGALFAAWLAAVGAIAALVAHLTIVVEREE